MYGKKQTEIKKLRKLTKSLGGVLEKEDYILCKVNPIILKEYINDNYGDGLLILDTKRLKEKYHINKDLVFEITGYNFEEGLYLITDASVSFDSCVFHDDIYVNAKVIKGSIKKNAKITSESSIVIIGDVKKNAKVEAKGNIIVVGSLEGEAYAGFPDDKSMFVVASDFACDVVTIGGVVGKPMMHKKWTQRVSNKETEPLGVVVWNGHELLIEPIRSGILKNIK